MQMDYTATPFGDTGLVTIGGTAYSLVYIPGRPTRLSATTVRASIQNDTSHGGFSVTTLASWASAPTPPDESPAPTSAILGHKVARKVTGYYDVDQQTDGSPLAVTELDSYVEVIVAFTAPANSWGTFTSTLLVQADGWDDINVPCVVTVAEVTTYDPDTTDLAVVQGQNVDIILYATLLAGPNTKVDYKLWQAPNGVTMDPATINLTLGKTQAVTLLFHISGVAQVGAHQQMSITLSAFGGGQTATITKYISIDVLPRHKKTALVLAGGGSRGAFEVGAVRCLFDVFRVEVDIISGASVGALNGAKLAEGSGALDGLENIWLQLQLNSDMYVDKPWFQQLSMEYQRYLGAGAKSIAEAISGAVFSLWTGFLIDMVLGPLGMFFTLPGTISTVVDYGMDAGTILAAGKRALNDDSMFDFSPTRNLIEANINPAKILQSGIIFRAAMVDLEGGATKYMTESATFSDLPGVSIPFTDGVVASASIPLVFPPVTLNGSDFIDGGTRQNVPIQAAIDAGAQAAYVIVPTVLDLPSSPPIRKIRDVAPRLLSIMLDEMQQEEIDPYNSYAFSPTVIAPRLSIHDALTIDPGLIAINMAYGYMRAFDETQDKHEIASALRDLSDAITKLRVDAWRQEFLVNARWPPDRVDMAGVSTQYVPIVGDMVTLRKMKTDLRAKVDERISLSSPDSVPAKPVPLNTWWQLWERHNWTPIGSPWDAFTDISGTTLPAAAPPPPI